MKPWSVIAAAVILAAGIVIGQGLAAPQPKAHDIVVTHELRIVDDSGRTWITLRANKDAPGATFDILDAAGHPVILCSTKMTQDPVCAWSSPDQAAMIAIVAGKNPGIIHTDGRGGHSTWP